MKCHWFLCFGRLNLTLSIKQKKQEEKKKFAYQDKVGDRLRLVVKKTFIHACLVTERWRVIVSKYWCSKISVNMVHSLANTLTLLMIASKAFLRDIWRVFFCFCDSSSLIHGYILYDRASSYIINDPDIPGLARQKKNNLE